LIREYFARLKDPRVFQIWFQTFLILTGVLAFDFYITPGQIALTYAAGCLTQWAFLKRLGLQGVGYKSALITCNGLVLFLRAETLWVHPLAAAIAMASKFVIRFRGKHVYNPSNFGAIAALLLIPGAWLAPGQWGYGFLTASWCVALGSIVVLRAERTDISWTFLGFYLGLVGLRTFLHGVGWTAWLYPINGALLIFTFFMISDPMTIPDRRWGRVVFAGLVAGLAYLLQYPLYQLNARIWMEEGLKLTTSVMATKYHPYGLLFALFLCSPLVPVIDKLWRGRRYEWCRPAAA
jgi:enediyne biosynthesis protein E5